MTPATETPGSPEIESFRQQARMTELVVRLNVEGVTHAESLIRPRPAGNCVNWLVGHLLWVYDSALPMLRQTPVLGTHALQRYARGTPPLEDPAQALPLPELLNAWEEAVRRIDAGLTAFPADALHRPAEHAPGGEPGETVRSLLSGILFHQAYHAGQLGILRRLLGKSGAIA